MPARETYAAMRKAADDYAEGLVDGDALHSAVVNYTDDAGLPASHNHYQAAERLLAEHRRLIERGAVTVVPLLLHEAQAHATLALADVLRAAYGAEH